MSTFDIKARVVPWHQFVYSLVMPCGRLLFNQHPSGLHHLRSVYQYDAPSFLETGKNRRCTFLRLLFHIVAFNIKARVVPWHQFVYTLFIPCGRLVIQPASFSLHHLRSVYQYDAPSFLEIGKNPTVHIPSSTFPHSRL